MSVEQSGRDIVMTTNRLAPKWLQHYQELFGGRQQWDVGIDLRSQTDTDRVGNNTKKVNLLWECEKEAVVWKQFSSVKRIAIPVESVSGLTTQWRLSDVSHSGN